ncbi:MAG TPA: ABC transporter permease [Longimicrobiales bacterium]
MPDLVQDVRYGIRLLIKDRGFTIAALLTLALCIGANTAMFSIVSSVLLKPLPFPDSDRIVTLYNSYPNAGAERASAGIPDYFDRLAGTTAFEELALYQESGLTIGEAGKPERVSAMRVTPSLLRLLKVSDMQQGRIFTEEEGELGQTNRAVLTHGFWQERYAGKNVTGEILRVSGEAFTIVGVLPRNFVFEEPGIQLFVPLVITPDMRSDERRHGNSWNMLGRLKPDATLAQAQAQIDAVNAANDQRFPQFRELLAKAGFHTVVANYRNDLIRDVRGTLVLLQAGVFVILLIGCVNIANLILIRSTSRSRELATRAAFGASNRRLIRQLLSESVVLSIAGGALGLVVGYGALKLFLAFGADQLPRVQDIHLAGDVILATFGLALLAGLTFGCIPALRLWRADLNAVFREEGRAVAVSRQAAAARGVLVVTQVALAFAMLIGAGLLLKSFANTLAVDPGFKPENVLTANISLPYTSYQDDNARRQATDEILERVRNVPGVQYAGATAVLPMSDDFSSSVITAEGYVPDPGESVLSPMSVMASPGYFESMGIEMVSGRTFTNADREGGLPVAIIDEWLAQRYFPGQDPIGKRICQCIPGVDIGSDLEWKTIVGVAHTLRMEKLAGDKIQGQYYFPLSQEPRSHVYLTVRANGDPLTLIPALRAGVTSVDPDLPLYDIATMNERISTSLADNRIRTVLLVGFGVIAVLLAAIGIYGVLAYSVLQRTSEIGVRLALGSSTSTVFRLIVAQGMKLLGGGLVIGGAAALMLGKLVEGFLFGVTAREPVVYVAVAVLLSGVALIACAVPARRAMTVEPGVALRS